MPSLDQDLLQPAAVTRLRNQLLEAEYYQLGVEVRHRADVCPMSYFLHFSLGHGKCLGHDQFASVGAIAGGVGDGGDDWDNKGIESVFGSPQAWLQVLSPKGVVFPPGLHKDWP